MSEALARDAARTSQGHGRHDHDIATAEFFKRTGINNDHGHDRCGAGVAVQTVHFVFHTKGELLTAAVESAVLGERVATRGTQVVPQLMSDADSAPAAARTSSSEAGAPRPRERHRCHSFRGTDRPRRAAAFDRLERLRWDGYRSL